MRGTQRPEHRVTVAARVGVENRASAPTYRVEGADAPPSERGSPAMKYVILIHSNPEPWGHPTSQLHRGGPGAAAGAARRDGPRVRGAADRDLGLRASSSPPRRWPTPPRRRSTAGARRATWPPTARTPRRRSSWPASSSSTAPPASGPRRSPRSSPSPAAWSSSGRRCGRAATTSDRAGAGLEDVWRACAPHVLAALVRTVRRLRRRRGRRRRRRCWRPSRQWPADGVPDNPPRLADHGRLAAAGGPVAQRAGPGRPRAGRGRARRGRAGAGADGRATVTTR